MRSIQSTISFFALAIVSLLIAGGCVSEPTRYESTTEKLVLPQAPPGTKKTRIALIRFRDLTGRRGYLMEPATAQLTTLLLQTGYFDVIEPSLVENIIPEQSAVSTENLAKLREKHGAELFLTGSLTNFEIKERRSGFCLLFGLLGSYNKREYIVETGIDYRVVSVPEAEIAKAGAIENRRVDTSKAAGFLLSYGGNDQRVLASNSGKLLRYALRDLTVELVQALPARR